MVQYDVFISHKKEQLSWALRLQETLELLGYSTFVDHNTANNLVAEQDWKQQLQEHCVNARHMILLWSDKIGVGSFVHQEISWRIQEFHQNPLKRITLLPLDESPLSFDLQNHYGNRQAFRDFIALYKNVIPDTVVDFKKQRDEGAERVDFFAWNDAAKRFVEQTFYNAQAKIIEIPFVVIAMTDLQAQELINGKNLDVPPAIYDQMMKFSKLTTVSFDIGRYGKQPEDWKPFPQLPAYDWQDRTISQILSTYEKDRRQYVKVNQAFVNSSEYRLNRFFVSYTGQLNGSPAHRSQAIRRLEKRPCLVFIDPVSLMHRQVRRLFSTISTQLEYAFTIGMSPFVPVLHKDFTDYLAEEFALIDELGLRTPYDRFRSFFNDALKASVMSVDHGFELARWVQFATDNIARYMDARLNDEWNSNPNLILGPQQPPTF